MFENDLEREGCKEVSFALVKLRLEFDPMETEGVQEGRKTFPQPGIPTDSTANNELSNWIYEARIVTRNLKNQELRFAIKGNAKDEFPAYKKVVDVLQKQSINKFSLITSLKTK